MRKHIKLWLVRILVVALLVTQVQPMPVMAMGNVTDNIPESVTDLEGEVESVIDTTEDPATEPAEVPVVEPAEVPVAEPTEVAAVDPTEEPVAEPTEVAAAEPTEEPVTGPTEEPVTEPTEVPAVEATEAPVVESTEVSVVQPGEELAQEPAMELTGTQTPEEKKDSQNGYIPLELDKEIQIVGGEQYFSLEITEPGYYVLEKKGAVSILMLDSNEEYMQLGDIWNVTEAGTYSLQVCGYDIEGMSVKIIKNAITDLSLGETVIGTISEEKNYYMFTTDKEGKYNFSIEGLDSVGNVASMCVDIYLYDSNGSQLFTSGYYGFEKIPYNSILQADTTYILEITKNPGENVATNFRLTVKRILELTKAEIKFRNGKGIYYYGLGMNGNPSSDIYVAVTYENGVEAEISMNTYEWTQNGFGGILFLDMVTGESAQTDENGNYLIGDYRIVLCDDLNPDKIIAESSVYVKSFKEMEEVLTLGNTIGTFSGDGKEHIIKLKIEEAGIYTIESDSTVEYSWMLYDAEGNNLSSYCYSTSNFTNVFQGNEIYYLRFYSYAEDYSLTMKNVPNAVKQCTVLQEPVVNFVYQELGWSDYDYLQGIQLQFELYDGTIQQCGLWDDVWNQYINSYSLRRADGNESEYDENGRLVAGEYVLYFMDQYNRELVTLPVTIKSIKDTDLTLTLEEETTYSEGRKIFKLEVPEEGMYRVVKDGSFYVLDSDLNNVATNHFCGFYGKGTYYIVTGYDYETEHKIKVTKEKVVELTLGETYSADVERDGYDVWYKVVPAQAGTYQTKVWDEDYTNKIVNYYDINGNNCVGGMSGGGALSSQVDSINGEIFFIYVQYDTNATGTYQVLAKRAPEVKKLELIQAPYRYKLFYGMEVPTQYDYLRGFKIGITFEDDSYVEFYESCEQWNDLRMNWVVKNAQGADVYNGHDCPVGDYRVYVSVAGSKQSVEIPVSVVALDEVENVLTLERPTKTFRDITAPYAYDVTKVVIDKPGEYIFTSSCEHTFLNLYDNAPSMLLSTTGNGFYYTFEQAGTYYLRTAAQESEYTITMEKTLDIVKLEAEYTAGDGTYYYLMNQYRSPFDDIQVKVTLANGSKSIFKRNMDEWNTYIKSNRIRNTITHEDVSQDEKCCYPVGDYYVEIIDISGNKTILPVTVKSLTEYPIRLSPDEDLTLKRDESLAYQDVAIYCPTAGQYYVELEHWMSWMLMDDQFSRLQDNNGKDISFKAEGQGYYYLRIWQNTSENTLAMEKLKAITDITINEEGEWVSYYGVGNYSYANDKAYWVYFEDGSKHILDMTYHNESDQEIVRKYGLKYGITKKDGSSAYTDQNGKYPVDEYQFILTSSAADITRKRAYEIKDKNDIPNVLTVDSPVSGLTTDGFHNYVKLVVEEAGTYSFESTKDNSYLDLLCDEENVSLISNYYLYNLNEVKVSINKPGTYYMVCSAYNATGTFEVSVKKEADIAGMKPAASQKEIYAMAPFNNVGWLGLAVDLVYEDGRTETMTMFDNLWSMYSCFYMIYAADDLDSPLSLTNYPQGNYVMRVIMIRNSKEYTCDVPFTVISPNKAPKISLDKESTCMNAQEIFVLTIAEDGKYQCNTPSNKGTFTFYNEDGKYVGSCAKDSLFAINLKAGEYIVKVYNGNYMHLPTPFSFTISKMPDIESIAYNDTDKLEVKYGTWGYYVSSSVSGNFVSTSGDNRPMVPGAEITGMKTQYTDLSGNSIVSGNSVWKERFTLGITLNAVMDDGSRQEMFFNSPIWEAYGIIEKVYHPDGSPIYADENGYAPIGDYVIEFEGQGKSVQLPFYIIESERAKDIRKADITVPNQSYDGKERKPLPTVTYGKDALVLNKDFRVSYADNVNVGTGKVTITGIGKYSGTVTATFEIQKGKYKVNFNGNGATSGTMASMSCQPDTSYTLTVNAYKKTGYSFNGWNTKADGSGKAYTNKASVKNLAAAGGSITLYAQWKIVEYQISYYLNGGIQDKSNPKSYNVTTPTFTLKAPVRCGYRFEGWYTTAELKVKANATFTVGSTGNKARHAKWVYTGAEHDWDAGVITKQPTTSSLGVRKYTCTVCGATKTESIPAKLPVVEKPYKITNVVSGIHVYWKEVSGTKKYGLWRSENGKNGTYKWIANPTVPHFTDVKVESGKTYYYKVTVMNVDANVHGAQSEAIGTTFVGTPDITSRVNKAAGISLGWGRITGATGYAIYRKSYSGTDAWVRVATITDPNKLSWDDTSVKAANGTIYRYTVRALAGSNRNILSGCRSEGRSMVRLSSMTMKSAVKASVTSIKCTWPTSGKVSGYEVRFVADGEVTNTFNVTDYKVGTKTFGGLQKGKTYKVQIRSYKNVSGLGKFYSAWSVAQSVNL